MMQLIDIDVHSLAMRLNATGLAACRAQDSKPLLAVVSCGKAGLGKSAVMNLLCGPPGPFTTSDGAAACTQGIQIAMDEKDRWWCDVEGERGSAGDSLPVKLAVLAGTIGNVFLYHHRGRVQKEELLPVLSTLADAAARVGRQATPFGHLIVVLRDTPGNSAAHQAAFRQLLQAPAEDVQGPACADSERFEAARRAVCAAFQSVDVCCLPYPFGEDANRHTASFCAAVEVLREKIAERLNQPRTLDGLVLTCQSLTLLLPEIVTALETTFEAGSVPLSRFVCKKSPCSALFVCERKKKRNLQAPDTVVAALDRHKLTSAVEKELKEVHALGLTLLARQPEDEAKHKAALEELAIDAERRFLVQSAGCDAKLVETFQLKLRTTLDQNIENAMLSNAQALAAQELAVRQISSLAAQVQSQQHHDHRRSNCVVS